MSDIKGDGATDFAGFVKRAVLMLFAGTALFILIVIGTWLVGHTVMFAMMSLGASSDEAGFGTILVTVLFFVGSLSVSVGTSIHLEEAIGCWIKTGRVT